MPRAISTSPAPPASTTPAFENVEHAPGVRARASSPRAKTARSSSGGGRPAVLLPLALLRHLADDGEHRPLDRPHALTAAYAVSLAARRRERERRLDTSRLAERPRRSHATICEKMTPELPSRAHQRRAESRPSRLLAVRRRDASQRLDDRAHCQNEVGARVPVRDRIDVEVVDPTPVRLEVAQCAAREVADESSSISATGRLRVHGPRAPRRRSSPRRRTICTIAAGDTAIRPRSVVAITNGSRSTARASTSAGARPLSGLSRP